MRPLQETAQIIEKICTSPSLSHVMMDISWDETAKYATTSPETIRRTADMINKYPERFMFGSDCVAPDLAG